MYGSYGAPGPYPGPVPPTQTMTYPDGSYRDPITGLIVVPSVTTAPMSQAVLPSPVTGYLELAPMSPPMVGPPPTAPLPSTLPQIAMPAPAVQPPPLTSPTAREKAHRALQKWRAGVPLHPSEVKLLVRAYKLTRVEQPDGTTAVMVDDSDVLPGEITLTEPLLAEETAALSGGGIPWLKIGVVAGLGWLAYSFLR